MAELGDINVIDVNRGTRPIDRSAESRAIGTALKVTGKIIEEGVESVVKGDLQDSLNEDLAAANAERTAFTALINTPAEVQADLSSKIKTAQAQIAQAPTAGHRTAAIIRLQRIQQNARAKFGFMGDEIDAAARNLMTNSAQLTQLGALDSAASAGSPAVDQAQDFLDDLKAYAFDTLNMDPQFAIGSPQFIRQYKIRTEDVQIKATTDIIVESLRAEGNLDSQSKLQFLGGYLDARWATVNTQLYRPMTDAVLKLQAIRDSGADEATVAQAILDFQNGPMKEFVTIATKIKSDDLESFDNQWTPVDRASSFNDAAQSAMSSHVDRIDAILQALNAGDVDIVAEWLKVNSYIRGTKLVSRMPTLQALSDIDPIVGNVLTLISANDLTFSTSELQNLMANGMSVELQAALAGQNFIDDQTLNESVGSESYFQLLDAQDKASEFSGGMTDSKSPKDKAIEYMGHIEADFIKQSKFPSSIKNSEYAQQAIRRAGDTLHRLNGVRGPLSNQDPSIDISAQVDKLTTYFASDNFLALAQIAPENEKGPAALEVLADSMGRNYFDNRIGMASQAQSVASLLHAGNLSLFGTEMSLIDIVTIDDSDLDKSGTIRFTVIPERVDALIEQARLLPRAPDFVPDVLNRYLEALEGTAAESFITPEAIQAQANLLAARVTEYLRVRGHFGVALAGGGPVNYRLGFGTRAAGITSSLSSLFAPKEQDGDR